MKILASVLALALASTAAAAPALACGDVSPRVESPPAAENPPVVKLTTAKKSKKARKAKTAKKAERAVGQWPALAERDGKLYLELHYPTFEISSERRYMDTFEIVDNDQAAQLRYHLEWNGKSSTLVTIEQMKSGAWKVVSFAENA